MHQHVACTCILSVSRSNAAKDVCKTFSSEIQHHYPWLRPVRSNILYRYVMAIGNGHAGTDSRSAVYGGSVACIFLSMYGFVRVCASEIRAVNACTWVHTSVCNMV